MKRRQVFFVVSFGVVLATACGGSTATSHDAGTDGMASSGTASSGTPGGSGSGSGGASSGRGSGAGNGGGADAGPTLNDCPNCAGSQVCCLTPMGTQVQGSCAASAAACPSGASAIPCTGADCGAGQVCCLSGGGAGSPASTQCASSCPAGATPACGDDPADCPGGPAGWTCRAVPGTPIVVVGICIPADGGAPEAGGDSGGVDGAGTVDGGDGGAPLSDAPTNG